MRQPDTPQYKTDGTLTPVASRIVDDEQGRRRIFSARALFFLLLAYLCLQVLASVGTWHLAVRSGGIQTVLIGVPPVAELQYRYLEGVAGIAFHPVQILYGLGHHAGFVVAVRSLRNGTVSRGTGHSALMFGVWLYYGVSIVLAAFLAVAGAIEALGLWLG